MYFDVSVRTDTLREVLWLARKNKQKAVFDVKNKKTIYPKPSRRKVAKKATGGKRVTFARPKDRSVEAYKAWIQGLAEFFGAEEDEEPITEEEWKRSAEAFWSKARPRSRGG